MAETYLCWNKKCRRSKGFDALRDALPSAISVRCQDVCKGPVVGITVNGRLEWFKKVRKAHHRRAILDAMTTGTASEALWKRRAEKRSGKLKTKKKRKDR